MSFEREQALILRSVQKYNILPLTSICNVQCVFCSHRQNPPEVEVYTIGYRSIDQVEEAMDFLTADRKIVIGESATKIIEGEPFCHPDFLTVLQQLRRRFKKTPIQITTNGTGLTPDIIEGLSRLQPLELYISLNSINADQRRVLMGDGDTERLRRGMESLAEHNIEFHGSIVAMPHWVGWDDLEQTVLFLDQIGALTIRIFLPGFTRLAPEELQYPKDLYEQLITFIKKMRTQISTPITLEPQIIEDLTPVIEGIISPSPAQKAGLRREDVIISINGQAPRSRVEAFKLLNTKLESRIVCQREGKTMVFDMERCKGERTGVVMSYDLSSDFWGDMNRLLRRFDSEHPLLLVSPLGEKVIKAAVRADDFLASRCRIQSVDSKFFGGSIGSAGLLVVEDFLLALTEYKGPSPDLLVLPSRAFDDWGRDLRGQSCLRIQEEKQIPVELLEV